MSKASYINISDLSNTKTACNRAKSRDGCVVVDRGTPIGVVISNDNAQAIIGDKIWDTDRYGHPISKITSSVIQNKEWFVPTINERSSAHITVFNKEFLKSNWEQIQLSLNPKIVNQMAKDFNMNTLPHIKLEANNHEIIQSSPNFDFGQPYIRLHKFEKSRFNDIGLEVNTLSTSVALVKEKGHGTDLTQIATILPISWLGDLQDNQATIEEISSREFSYKKSKRILKPDTAYVLTHRLSVDGQIIAVNKQPTENIQTVINDNSLRFTRLDLDKTKEQTPPNIKLSQFEAGNLIVEFIKHAISKTTTISQLIPMRKRTQFFAASGDPRVIDLIQKVPASIPVTIKEASQKGLFRRAVQDSWGRDQHERDLFLEHDKHLRKQFKTACDKTLTLLRDDSPQVILVTDKEKDVVCVVTGDLEVARIMKALEL